MTNKAEVWYGGTTICSKPRFHGPIPGLHTIQTQGKQKSNPFLPTHGHLRPTKPKQQKKM